MSDIVKEAIQEKIAKLEDEFNWAWSRASHLRHQQEYERERIFIKRMVIVSDSIDELRAAL